MSAVIHYFSMLITYRLANSKKVSWYADSIFTLSTNNESPINLSVVIKNGYLEPTLLATNRPVTSNEVTGWLIVDNVNKFFWDLSLNKTNFKQINLLFTNL